MPHEIENWGQLVDYLTGIDKDSLAVLDCYASWCSPCKSIAPFYEKLSKKYTNVHFLKADIEKVDKICEEFEVTSMPTFIFLKNLSALCKIKGANREKLESNIIKYR